MQLHPQSLWFFSYSGLFSDYFVKVLIRLDLQNMVSITGQ